MEHGGFSGEETMALPPGFRFYPTDEELITHYLSKKVTDAGFVAGAIGEADLNKCEPWDLPWRAKMGEKEWYFFCMKDRKYPTGLRTNRATESGYWKATGKDKEIQRGKNLVGMKKTLVFYRGRAPKGEKTNWVMHEFRLEGKLSSLNLPKASKNEWVICRVFQKNGSGVKKTLIGSPVLPPLMDMAFVGKNRGSSAHVTCFSNAMEGHQGHEEELLAEGFNPAFFSSPVDPSSSTLQHSSYGSHGDLDLLGSLQCQGGSLVHLLESNGFGFEAKQSCKTEMQMLSISEETGLTSDMNPEISSVISNHKTVSHEAPLQLSGCLWN